MSLPTAATHVSPLSEIVNVGPSVSPVPEITFSSLGTVSPNSSSYSKSGASMTATGVAGRISKTGDATTVCPERTALAGSVTSTVSGDAM